MDNGTQEECHTCEGSGERDLNTTPRQQELLTVSIKKDSQTRGPWGAYGPGLNYYYKALVTVHRADGARIDMQYDTPLMTLSMLKRVAVERALQQHEDVVEVRLRDAWEYGGNHALAPSAWSSLYTWSAGNPLFSLPQGEHELPRYYQLYYAFEATGDAEYDALISAWQPLRSRIYAQMAFKHVCRRLNGGMELSDQTMMTLRLLHEGYAVHLHGEREQSITDAITARLVVVRGNYSPSYQLTMKGGMMRSIHMSLGLQ